MATDIYIYIYIYVWVYMFGGEPLTYACRCVGEAGALLTAPRQSTRAKAREAAATSSQRGEARSL